RKRRNLKQRLRYHWTDRFSLSSPLSALLLFHHLFYFLYHSLSSLLFSSPLFSLFVCSLRVSSFILVSSPPTTTSALAPPFLPTRLLSAVPNVDVYINSVLIYENVGYGFVGSYLRADPNVVTKVDLRLAGASRKEIPYVSRQIFMPPAARWTLLVSGIARSFENPITLVISVEQEGNEVLSS
ncbi:hypothetical protein QOT17_023809, partial [Balamuthia mandrillaris]